jgi:putative RNA 2'-phosphotransferase
MSVPLRPADISRAISHALRHEPWLYELQLDAEGWVDLDALLAALQKLGPDWTSLALGDITRAVEQSDKQRHEIAGTLIRARNGHSVPGRVVNARRRASPARWLAADLHEELRIDAVARTSAVVPDRKAAGWHKPCHTKRR